MRRVFKIGKPEKCLEVPTYFYLENENGEICLKARDNEGCDYYIATITTSGKLNRHSAIGDNLGLSLDGIGRITLIG